MKRNIVFTNNYTATVFAASLTEWFIWYSFAMQHFHTNSAAKKIKILLLVRLLQKIIQNFLAKLSALFRYHVCWYAVCTYGEYSYHKDAAGYASECPCKH